ncbi:hypothetical protein FN846DRAFT_143877 [Sphaerosporella brunnea]|uniref:DNA (cytosine-5)-methyltransferase 1 replication foci domain-containing protein n=1 Tax=Sphaerosporella brunnea TaxID=1250544 RepID=A0A5J5ERL7_9PEZI|nr:hypothetical protein FN846DRAFT_143877 [Sphaerosporella brunnea]
MHERDALRACDFNNIPESTWPVFELSNVTVFDLKNRIVDLFAVTEFGPFWVIGKLEPLDTEFERLVLDQRLYDGDFVLPQVWSYSIDGSKDEAGMKFWVLGGAGWYLIKPSPEYEETFEGLRERADLWNFINDTIETPTFEEILLKHPQGIEYGAYMINLHHRWIIMRMIENPDTKIHYENTTILTWYSKTYPKVFDEVDKVLSRQGKLFDRIGLKYDLTKSPSRTKKVQKKMKASVTPKLASASTATSGARVRSIKGKEKVTTPVTPRVASGTLVPRSRAKLNKEATKDDGKQKVAPKKQSASKGKKPVRPAATTRRALPSVRTNPLPLAGPSSQAGDTICAGSSHLDTPKSFSREGSPDIFDDPGPSRRLIFPRNRGPSRPAFSANERRPGQVKRERTLPPFVHATAMSTPVPTSGRLMTLDEIRSVHVPSMIRPARRSLGRI